MDDVMDVKAPAIMLGISMAVFVGYGFFAGGAAAATTVLLFVGIALAFQVVVGLAGCVVASKVGDITYGPIHLVALKLAAIFAVTAAITLLIPYLGWLLALICYVVLLAALFDLEGHEVFITIVILFVVRLLANLAAGAILAG